MTTAYPRATEVKRANRRLYDAVAAGYEAVDGRRNESLSAWIRGRLSRLADGHGHGRLLDVGSGSGVVSREGRGLFDQTIALDLSPAILAGSGSIADARVAADTDALPIADASVDVVTCFAVLHHLFDAGGLAREVGRVLKPGGVFWSDHDMDLAFYTRFRRPLAIYRRLRGAEAKYARASTDIDAETYALAEFRENGVDGSQVLGQLRDAGMRSEASFHWFGLAGLTNCLFGERALARGWAPLLSITAVKVRECDAKELLWKASNVDCHCEQRTGVVGNDFLQPVAGKGVSARFLAFVPTVSRSLEVASARG